MKIRMKIEIAVFTIIIIVLIIFTIIQYSSNEKVVTGKDYLYERVEQYLISQEKPHYYLETKDSKPNYNVSDFKVFTDLAKLGIRECKDEIYVYVWALVESYYVQDGNLINNGGSSIPYKFILKNDEIVDYEAPVDGSDNKKSMEKIFPIDMHEKLNSSLVDSNKIRNEVKEYYSYLNIDDTFNEIEIKNDKTNIVI